MKSYFIEKFSSLRTARYTEDGFDLDLTYVTDRVIAMSFPGSGFNVIYRNSGSAVAKLLEKNHGSHYLVFNLSGEAYDYKKFNYQVREFPWEDHQSPPVHLLFEACQSIHNFIQADPKNVIAVHCHAGKGRTGTIIVCYMLWTGRFATADDALEYYRRKRFREAGGVTQPSQLRVIKYFERVFNSYLSLNKFIDPMVVHAESIIIKGIPDYGGAFKPVFKIYRIKDKQLLYNSAYHVKPVEYNVKDFSEITYHFGKSPELVGDLMFKIYHENTLGVEKTAFRFSINTSFLETDSNMKAVLRLDRANIDPYEIRKNKKFSLDFKVEVHFRVLLKGGSEWLRKTPDTQLTPLQKTCVQLYNAEQANWNVVYDILSIYKVPSKDESSTFLFNSLEKDDIAQVLSEKREEIKPETEQFSEVFPGVMKIEEVQQIKTKEVVIVKNQEHCFEDEDEDEH